MDSRFLDKTGRGELEEMKQVCCQINYDVLCLVCFFVHSSQSGI
jgi:hypothetical protein